MSSTWKKRRQNDPGPVSVPTATDHELEALERRMGGLAGKAETEHGDIDLGQLTGPEALRYMSALGITIGGRS